MILLADNKKKSEVYHIWKTVFSFDDFGSIDYYFNHQYDNSLCYIIEKEGKVVSTLSVNKHDLFLHGKKIKVSYILGVATVASYRKQGLMRTMMHEVLEQMSHQDLVTILQAYDENLYKQYGFEMIYYNNKYFLTRNQVENYSTTRINSIFSSQDLLSLYEYYTKYFNGFVIRNLAYYDNFIAERKAQNMKIVVYKDVNGSVCGYMSFSIEQSKVVIDEIIYKDAISLVYLLSYALNIRTNIEVVLSSKENLKKIIPTAIAQKTGCMMARINDYSLFNRLYNCNVQTVQDAFKISNKPLFIHEDW